MINRSIRFNLLAAGLIIALAALLGWAGNAGLVDKDLGIRVTLVLTGLFTAANANLAPKMSAPGSARRLAMQRVNGWAFVLAGIGSALVWAVLPLQTAAYASMVIVGVAFLAVLNYCIWIRPHVA